MGPAPLRLRAVEHRRDGVLQPAVGVGDHQPRSLMVVIVPLRCGCWRGTPPRGIGKGLRPYGGRR
jgi:hypothetical protein